MVISIECCTIFFTKMHYVYQMHNLNAHILNAEDRDKTIAWINSCRDSKHLIHIEDITLNKQALNCLTADLEDGAERYVDCLVST